MVRNARLASLMRRLELLVGIGARLFLQRVAARLQRQRHGARQLLEL